MKQLSNAVLVRLIGIVITLSHSVSFAVSVGDHTPRPGEVHLNISNPTDDLRMSVIGDTDNATVIDEVGLTTAPDTRHHSVVTGFPYPDEEPGAFEFALTRDGEKVVCLAVSMDYYERDYPTLTRTNTKEGCNDTWTCYLGERRIDMGHPMRITYFSSGAINPQLTCFLIADDAT